MPRNLKGQDIHHLSVFSKTVGDSVPFGITHGFEKQYIREQVVIAPFPFNHQEEQKMADTAGDVKVGCNDRCGCPTPCPGGVDCRCTSKTEATSGDGHMKCSCGDHCGCNPCTCTKSVVTTGTGRAYCKCGEGCTCVSCAA